MNVTYVEQHTCLAKDSHSMPRRIGSIGLGARSCFQAVSCLKLPTVCHCFIFLVHLLGL